MKKFTKKNLIEQLELTEEKAKIVMKAQKEFPELLETEGEGFVMDGEKLCKELGVKDNFNTWLLGETKYDSKCRLKSQGKLIKYRCIENTDFIVNWESPKNSKGGRPKSIITLTLNCAKKIAMKQNTEQGDLICDYFIILEEAIKKKIDWINVRNPQKESYKKMCEIIKKEYIETHDGEEPNFYIYTNNADMLNLSLFSKKSKPMKDILEIEWNEPMRDSLTREVNLALCQLQDLNGNLVINHIDFQTRKIMIETICKAKYMDLRVRFVSEFNKELNKIHN